MYINLLTLTLTPSEPLDFKLYALFSLWIKHILNEKIIYESYTANKPLKRNECCAFFLFRPFTQIERDI